MASRHDIINITFQANAGKANVALQTLQNEAKKSSDQVTLLKKQLQDGIKANLPAADLQKIRDDIKKAEKDTKQWSKAYQELTKGVRTLDEAVKQFNAGTMNKMSAAFNKAAANAAKLAQTKMVPGTQEWKEMDALIVEAQSNVLKANTAVNDLTNSIKKGGTASKSTLSQAKMDLEQLLTLEVQGSKEWERYNKQLKIVTGELNKIAEAEKKTAQADRTAAMTKRMKNLKTMSSEMLAETKRYWETMVAGAEKGSAELSKYEAKLKQVTAEERARKTVSAETILATPKKFGAEQIRQAVQQMMQLRDSVQEGIPAWYKYNNLIKQGEAYLKEFSEREKVARGEAMSLKDALKVSSTAGGKGFSGTATQLRQAEEALQKAASTATKGSSKWLKYQEALAKVRVEMSNASITSERMQEILAKPANAKNLNELAAAVKRAKAELDLMAETVGKDSKAYTQLAESTKKAEIQLKALQAQSHGTANAFDKAWSRLKTYIGLYMGAAVAIQKLTATFGDIMDLSDKMGEVRKTTGFTADEVGRLSNNLRKLDVRTPLVGLMEVSAAAGQLGLKTLEDVQGFTEAANKLMIALPEMGKEAATEMMRVAIATGEVEKIRKQLIEGTIEGSSATAVAMEKIASTIDRLRASSASTAPEITDFVKRVGAVGAQSGITIDQVSALGSTISSLGMRVEMSATALSRMIPAIKNNAFDIARAIGVTPDTIRNLFEAGRGMEAILMILQHMKDAGMDEDSIEAMMGMGGMRDIMKDLNQQGARAGIVFAGLSQNVEELRRQLGVASQAYEENIAIQQEFDKMNETTAARWERLKNQLEEAFVGDQTQRVLGVIIDGIRKLIDLLTGDGGLSVALKTVMAYVVAIKIGVGQAFAISIPKAFAAMTAAAGSFFTTASIGLKALVWQLGVHNASLERARMEWKKMDLAMKSNWIGAIAAAVLYLAYKLWDLHQAAKETAAEIGRFNQKMAEEKKALDDLFKPLEDGNTAYEEKQRLIADINSKYGKYLGYMLSEASTAVQVADAHALIAKRIREEAYERRIAEQEKKIQEKYNDDLNADYGKIVSRVRGGAKTSVDVNDLADSLKRFVDQNLNNIEKRWGGGVNLSPEFSRSLNGYMDRLVADGKISRGSVDGIKSALISYMNTAKDQHNEIMSQTSNMRSDLRGIQGAIKTDLANNINALIGNVIRSFNPETLIPATETAPQRPKNAPPPMLQRPEGSDANIPSIIDVSRQSNSSWQAPWSQGSPVTQSGQNQQKMAPTGRKPSVDKKNIDSVRKLVQDQEALRSALQSSGQQIDEAQRKVAESWLLTDEELKSYKKILEKAERGSTGANGGWGEKLSAESTAYTEMNAEQLVTRRKQMKDFVNAIQSDSDVKAVLAEDKALQKAIREGMSSDFRTVVEWYNTERLKIQDELNARHLTNTGDWKDPKQEKARKKRLQEQWRYYLDEIDAYYTERKTRIQEAANEEGVTQAEVQNRTLANEAEWHQRRAELQKLYAGKAAEVTRDEQDALFNIIADRTDDDVKYIEKSVFKVADFMKKIGEKSPVEYKNALGKLDKEIEKDFFQQQTAIQRHLKAIQDIIDKERPFNGITKNLRENLVTMGILTADMTKERNRLMKENADMSDFNARQAAEEVKRTVFMLGEAENAYTATVEEVMKRMADAGMKAWADELKGSPEMQEGMMAQLRATYDAIQEAIKKEASQMKKQAEIMWNNILLPGGDGKTTIKDAFEQAIAQLGVAQGRVSRANSMIGAGQASERVADRLAVKQMQLQLSMQQHYYNLMKKQGQQRIDDLRRQADELERIGKLEEASRKRQDAQHAEMSLNLAKTKEQTDILKQQEEIIARTEESEARLYKDLREWGDLFVESLKSVFEATNAGNAEYYNERAKLELTGKGGPGAGTYIVTENAGTSDAKAHYEYLDERQALERQHEIEQKNAQADAWKKVMDDINQKMSETITDQLNAALQEAATRDNTAALMANTDAIYASMGVKSSEGSASVQVSVQPTTQDDRQQFIEAMGDNPMAFWTDLADKATKEMQNQQQPAAEQANTDATIANTAALNTLTQLLGGQPVAAAAGGEAGGGLSSQAAAAGGEGPAVSPFFQLSEEETAMAMERIQQLWQAYNEGGVTALQQMASTLAGQEGIVLPPWQITEEGVATAMERMGQLWQSYAEQGIEALQMMSDAMEEMPNKAPDITNLTEEKVEAGIENANLLNQGLAAASSTATETIVKNLQKEGKTTQEVNNQMSRGTQSTFARMTAAANLYGIAYQAMSNDNLSATQKFEMIALQAAGNAAIAGIQAALSKSTGATVAQMPEIAAKSFSINPIAGAAIFAVISAVLGGLMGVAASKVAKSKQEIAQATGSSVGAGRLSTGMMTYAEGNVNEMTDPSTLTPGRHYNVDGADGRTYRAKYMGRDAKTHITTGPEFHLVGEKGREAIIDAHTTRNIQMNDPEIWHTIQTLYNGGSMSRVRSRRGRGVRAFAEGNVDEFDSYEEIGSEAGTAGGFGSEQMAAFQSSIDRNNELLDRALTDGIKGVFNVYGDGGLVDSYDKGKKTLTRHGEKR